MKMQLCSVGIVLVLLIGVTTWASSQVNPGLPVDQPVEVGKTQGKDKDGNPIKPTTTRGSTEEDGGFGMNLKNISANNARDVHIRVDHPKDGKISAAVWGGNPPAFTNHTNLPANTLEARGDLASGDETGVDLIITDKDDKPWDGSVRLSIWWSRGVNHNIWISATSPDTIGSGDPMTLLSALGIPGYDDSPVEVPDTSDTADLNMIVLAEANGFRFQKGSLVVSPSGNQVFEIDEDSTVVAAWDEEGEQVSSQALVSFSNPRIDVNGNFVIEVDRAADHTKHIVIVISGLRLAKLDSLAPGASTTVSFSGAAVAGGCMDDLYEIAIKAVE